MIEYNSIVRMDYYCLSIYRLIDSLYLVLTTEIAFWLAYLLSLFPPLFPLPLEIFCKSIYFLATSVVPYSKQEIKNSGKVGHEKVWDARQFSGQLESAILA